MSHLPRHVVWFGRLRNDRTFQEINSKLAATEDGRRKIYPILSLRFWAHAHIFSPVFTLIFLYVIGANQPKNVALTLLMLSLGSLSFAMCDSYGGAYADRNGCAAAIRLGLRLMIVLMALFGGITLLNEQLGRNVFIALWTMGQILVGLPLALMDGADTELTKKTCRRINGLSQEDGDHLEGVCTKLKYSGIALTSFVGCFMFVVLPAWLGAREGATESKALVGAALFLLTVISQAFALRQLRRVEEPEPQERNAAGTKAETAGRVETLFGRIGSALKAIYGDKVLATWILIIAVTEGWLLFSTYYFQLDALNNLIANAKDNLALLLIIPILYWFLSAVASFGGSYFNTWHKRAMEKEAVGEDDRFVTLRGGSVLDIPHVRLIAAAEILAIMLGVFVLHLAISAVFPQGYGHIGAGAFWLSLTPLLFFAAYQFLRGFAHPLLKTTLSNMVAARSLKNPTTTLSIATAGGRFFHAVSATLFMLCWLWLQGRAADGGVPASAGAETVAANLPAYTQALTATVVVVVLSILVLNVLSAVALDRKKRAEKAEEDAPPRPRLNEIPAIFGDRAFRSSVIKGAFFVCLAMSNILAPKLSAMGFLVFNVGAIPYALTFMLVDTVAETEGKGSSRKLWLAGICTYVVVGSLVFIAVRLPGTQSPEMQGLFNKLFGEGRINYVTAFDALFQSGVLIFVFASLCSFTVAQYLDIWLFLLLKRMTRGRALWLRSNLSTFISQTVDTVIFIGIGFRPSSLSSLLMLVIGQLGVKWMFSLLYTPLLYLAVRWIDKGKESYSV